MTRDDTAKVCAIVRLIWPHSTIGNDPAEVVTLWHSFLESYDAKEVEAAIRECAAEGREFAPTIPVLLKMLTERAIDAPDWDAVRAEVIHAIKNYRPTPGIGDPYQAPDVAYWSHPLIARFMDGCWDEWRMSSEHDGTFNAQQREAWKALAARSTRAVSLAAVGAPRRTGLRKPDYLASLPERAA